VKEHLPFVILMATFIIFAMVVLGVLLSIDKRADAYSGVEIVVGMTLGCGLGIAILLSGAVLVRWLLR
jgi:hypothetical protein